MAAAKQRAKSALQSKNRAVTAGDYEYLASQAPGANIRRTKALPLYHPDFPTGQVPGVVTVIVVPNSEDPNPMPNNTTLQAVCTYLDKHRLLTSELYVVGAVYRKIKIGVQLVVQSGADLATVKNAAQDSLTTFFHPLTGGNDGTGWPFGGEIYYSDVYRQILDVDERTAHPRQPTAHLAGRSTAAVLSRCPDQSRRTALQRPRRDTLSLLPTPRNA